MAGARFIIRDISPRGLGGRCDEPLCKGAFRKGESVAVILPDGTLVQTIVAWAKGNQFGMQFRDAVDPNGIMPEVKATAQPYVVPDTFRAATSVRRPGFSHK